MKKIIPFLFVAGAIIPAFYFSYGKKDDPNSYRDLSVKLIIPFDTARVLEMMHIVDSVNEVSKYGGEINGALYPEMDTIDLIWRGPITDSPEWVYADSVNADFETQHKNDFYLEPAAEELKITHLPANHTRIQFIGREYGGKSFPKDFEPYGHYAVPGRVFKYYAYKIYKPFSVYGPMIKSIADGQDEMTELMVK